MNEQKQIIASQSTEKHSFMCFKFYHYDPIYFWKTAHFAYALLFASRDILAIPPILTLKLKYVFYGTT
jgi:hypothetical protein